MARSVKLAMPFTELTVVVPLSVPVDDVMLAVTAEVPATPIVPFASRISTSGWPVNATAETAPDGVVPTASCVAGPAGGATVNEAEVVGLAIPEAVNESVVGPVPVTARFEKVATPLTAATAVVPESVPDPLA